MFLKFVRIKFEVYAFHDYLESKDFYEKNSCNCGENTTKKMTSNSDPCPQIFMMRKQSDCFGREGGKSGQTA